MMKKLLSIFTVLLLVSLLAVSAFAATDSKAQLVLDGEETVNTDELKTGDQFTVYIVLSPAEYGVNGWYYRPKNSAKTGNQENADILSQTFTVNWSRYANYLSLVGCELSEEYDSTADFKSKGSAEKDLFRTQIGYSNNDRRPQNRKFVPLTSSEVVIDETQLSSGYLTITFDRDGANKFAGYKVEGASSATGTTKFVVAKLTFEVAQQATSQTNVQIRLNDEYVIDGVTDSYKESAPVLAVSIVAANCTHKNEDGTPNASGEIVTKAPTCIAKGSYTFVCAGCDEGEVVLPIPEVDHNYTKEDGSENVVITAAPTCVSTGTSIIKCTVCGVEKADSNGTVAALGHVFPESGEVAWAPIVLSVKSCTTDAKTAYYCQQCHALAAHTTVGSAPSKDVATVAEWYYSNGHYYKNAALTNERYNAVVPASGTVVDATEGHKIEKKNGKYCCVNEGCESNLFVRYVGETSIGNGETAAAYTDYLTAIDYFATVGTYFKGSGIPSDLDCKIIIVEGQKALMNPRQVSTNNTVTKSFEEKKHDVHITVTSENTKNKSGIHFVDGCNSYFLYGPVTFENITISADFTSGVYMAARNYKLVMGKGIECLGLDGGMLNSSANETAVSSALNLTLEIPNIKLYLIGGILKDGGRDGFDPYNDLNTYLEIHSGQYWAVYHYNRSVSGDHTNAKGIVNFAGAVDVANLNVNSESGDINNSYALTIYNGTVRIVYDYRYKQTNVNGSGNVYDRIFTVNAKDMKVGKNDFKSVKGVEVEIGIYYAPEMADNVYVKAYIQKLKNGINAGYYNFPVVSGIAGEWCLKNSEEIFGTKQHVYVSNGKCPVCATVFCKNNNHTNLAEEVIDKATCCAAGSANIYCADCYTYTELNKELPIDENGHNPIWVDGIRKCEYCGLVSSSENVPTEIEVLYVSFANATKDGGFTPENPTDLDAALNYAASVSNDVTIYVVGRVVVPVEYTAPVHENTITICGYNGKGTFEFGGGEVTSSNMFYRLGGPTVFEDVEFSTGDSYAGVVYLEARHNKLVIGNNVTADFRNHNGTESSRINVLGGCYLNDSCDHETGDTDVTICSGIYNAIVAGSENSPTGSKESSCKESATLNLKFYGDVSAKEYIDFGSHEKNVETSNVEIHGILTCNKYITFGSYNKTTKNLNIYLFGGTMLAQTNTTTVAYLGATKKDAKNTVYIGSKLTVYYDPTNASSVTLANRIKDGADTAKLVLKTMDADGFCEVKKGAHTAGDTVKTVVATCYSEGYVISKCTACEKTYRSATTPVTDHAKSEATVIPATCASAGMLRYTCTTEGCNAVIFEINPAASTPLDSASLAAHNFDEKTGICVDCNANKTVVCGGIGHNYIETTVTASCGVGKAYECTVCGHTKVDLESENHTYGAYSITVEPTDTTPGVKSRTCKSCGKVDTALVYATDSLNTTAIATTESGNDAGLDVVTSKLNKYEKEALNALVNETVHGSEIKVSYEVKGNAVTNITYSIPVPAEYSEMNGVKIVVKDDDGKLHVVDFKIEKGYFVFNF